MHVQTATRAARGARGPTGGEWCAGKRAGTQSAWTARGPGLCRSSHTIV